MAIKGEGYFENIAKAYDTGRWEQLPEDQGKDVGLVKLTEQLSWRMHTLIQSFGAVDSEGIRAISGIPFLKGWEVEATYETPIHDGVMGRDVPAHMSLRPADENRVMEYTGGLPAAEVRVMSALVTSIPQDRPLDLPEVRGLHFDLDNYIFPALRGKRRR